MKLWLPLLVCSLGTALSVPSLQHFRDPDDATQQYWISGVSPNSWIVHVLDEPTEDLWGGFYLYKYMGFENGIFYTKRVWYEYGDFAKGRLKHTTFIYASGKEDLMYPIYKKTLVNIKDKPRWLQNISSMCMFKPKSANINYVSFNGKQIRPIEMPSLYIEKVHKNGKWTIDVK